MSRIIEEIQQNKYRSGTTSMKYLDQCYTMVYVGVAFKKLSPIMKIFNERLAMMESNGFMENWRRFDSYATTKIEKIGPQVLKMDHLQIGFLACCIPLVLGVVVLFSELAWSRIVTMSKKSSNNSRKANQRANCDAEIFSSELRRTQHQPDNVEPEELIEMHGIAVAEIHQEPRTDWKDLNESYHVDDLVRACQEICDDIDGIDDLEDKFDFTPASKKA